MSETEQTKTVAELKAEKKAEAIARSKAIEDKRATIRTLDAGIAKKGNQMKHVRKRMGELQDRLDALSAATKTARVHVSVLGKQLSALEKESK